MIRNIIHGCFLISNYLLHQRFAHKILLHMDINVFVGLKLPYTKGNIGDIKRSKEGRGGGQNCVHDSVIGEANLGV